VMHTLSQIFWQIVYLGALAAIVGVPIAVYSWRCGGCALGTGS
jgi:hypothetical protein